MPFEDAFPPTAEQEQKPAGGLRGLLGDNFHVPELDANTILLLLLVYFLVAEDGSEHLSDTLLIIGILLLLGF